MMPDSCFRDVVLCSKWLVKVGGIFLAFFGFQILVGCQDLWMGYHPKCRNRLAIIITSWLARLATYPIPSVGISRDCNKSCCKEKLECPVKFKTLMFCLYQLYAMAMTYYFLWWLYHNLGSSHIFSPWMIPQNII